jgi:iron(III) transport system ATP-binding protein
MSRVAVRCVGLTKAFGAVTAVDQLDLTVEQGQILALLGPSGCGKTTALRLVAGFEAPDAGIVEIGGRMVAGPNTLLAPEKRNVGMVFQEYALFPHLNVVDNIAYGLPRQPGRSDCVAEVMVLASLEGLEKRMPHQLSGGQQQRVALARALAPKPEVLLLDEPFSNLDAVLRTQMRQETRDILKASGATAIFVTHSREEAMVMGDVLAVMDRGRWEQVDAPERIFHAPATRFVATFMGIADFLPARLDNGALLTELGSAVAPEGLTAETRAEVMVRPDDVTIRPDESGSGVILERTFQGSFYLYRVALPSGNVVHCLEPHTEEHAVGLRVDVRFNGSHPPLCFVDGRRLGLDHNGARS